MSGEAERTIARYYWFQALVNSHYVIPTVVLFLQAKGLTFTQVMVVLSSYYFAKAAADVPTGAFADQLGRRTSLMIGCLGMAASHGIILIGPGFYTVFVGECLRGISIAFVQGADTALIYGYLKARGRAHEYQRVEGDTRSIQELGFMASNLVGGLLAAWRMELAWIVTIVMLLVAGAVVATLPDVAEAPVERGRDRWWASLGRHIWVGTRFVATQRAVRWGTLYATLLFVASRITFWVYQPFLQAAGIPVTLFGFLYASFHLVSALAAKGAEAFQKWVGRECAFVLMGVFAVVSLIGLGMRQTPSMVCLVYLQQVMWGLRGPIMRPYVIEPIPPAIRATSMSVFVQVNTLGFALVSPWLGLLVDRLSLGVTLECAGVVVAGCALWLWIAYPRQRTLTVSAVE